MNKKQGFYTYVMSNELGLVKVGQSENPERRRKDLESASGLAVTLEYYNEGWYLEELTHARLNEFSKKGEWFDCPVEKAISALKEAKAEHELLVAKNIKKTKAIIDSISIETFPISHAIFKQKDIKKLKDICKRESFTHMTLDEINLLHKFMLYKLVEFVGGVKELSKLLKTSPTTVYSWLQRGRISKGYAIKAANHKLLKNHFEAATLRTELFNK